MILKIIISEPWDFKSSDGENVLIVKVLKEKKDKIIAEAISDYNGKEGYLVITKRNSNGHINIIQKNNDGITTFGMIGVFFDRYSR